VKQQPPSAIHTRTPRRDAVSRGSPEEEKVKQTGQTHVVTIGIDRYQKCGRLYNAVNDARGALKAFTQLGFQPRASLVDDAATGDAMRRLISDDLRHISGEDSLIVFFAGHGHTETIPFADGYSKMGYIMPVDGDKKERSTWLRLKNWLNEIAHLPARHILVILDSCNSGIALEPEYRWRSGGEPDVPSGLKRLAERRSRRIITSALDDQLASDGGPRPHHSLFTGMLIEALNGGLQSQQGYVTGTALGMHIQEQVIRYTKALQTPDFGSMELDNRGEMLFPLRGAIATSSARTAPAPPVEPRAPSGADRPGVRQRHPVVRPPKPRLPVWIKGSSLSSVMHPAVPEPVTRSSTSFSASAAVKLQLAPGTLDPKLVAMLDRQSKAREDGALVLSTLVGQPTSALHAFATWSAQRGALTLVSRHSTVEEAITGLLSHMPWMRFLPAARKRIAAAGGLKISEVGASMDARGGVELKAWLESISAGDPSVLVAGWLLNASRDPGGMASALAAPPLRSTKLLAALGDMGVRVSLALHHDAPSQAWLGGAISVAGTLLNCMPWQAVAVAASEESAKLLQSTKPLAALALAKQGIVRTADDTLPSSSQEYERAIERVLWDELSKNRLTRNRFEYRVKAPVHEREREVEVMLASRSARLVVEFDSWHRDSDAQAYARERVKDTRLQRAGFSVMRFLPEDVEHRLDSVVDEIALGLGSRREQHSYL
jgi:very-short-patch-repair endonuclease